MAEASVIQDGDVVIWDVHGATQVLVEIRGKWYACLQACSWKVAVVAGQTSFVCHDQHSKAKLGNTWISLRQLVNQPWGIAVELAEDGSTLIPKYVGRGSTPPNTG